MPKVTADEILTQKHVRFFLQPGGPGPTNSLLYSGVDGAYLNIESVSNPRSGGINPINVHDPRRQGFYKRVGRSVDPPDLPSFTVNFLQKKDALPKHLVELGDCVTNFYQVVGDCKDLSDFTRGWTSYVKIMSNAENTTVEEKGGAWDGDEQLQDDLEFVPSAVYNVGKIGFGEKASVEVYSEVIDVVYGNRVQCGACGPSDNGTKLMYAVASNTVASPGQAPSVFYSVDGGLNWTEIAITGSASTDVPVAIDVVGNYLLVVFDDAGTGGYFYTELNSITGAPSATWTKVTTGFVTAHGPTDIWVQSPRNVWLTGRSGYIYKLTSVSAGVTVIDASNSTAENLNRIHGLEEIIVVTGDNGVVLYSTNRGRTFAATSANPSANDIDALWVVADFLWYVGDDGGDVYYTLDQGISWTQETSVNGAAVHDIVFATDEVGYISYTTAGPVAVITTTFNGGADWTMGSPRLLNVPTADRFNRIAVPDVPNANTAANNMLIGGLAGNGSDGIVLVGTVATV